MARKRHRSNANRRPTGALWLLAIFLGMIAPACGQLIEPHGNFWFVEHGSYIEIYDFNRNAGGPISIPPSIRSKPVTEIRYYAFDRCTYISSIEIPSSVTRIGARAFQGCTQIRSITIPRNVNNIGIQAFAGCTQLEAINVSSQNRYFSSSSGILYNRSKSTLVSCPPGKKGSVTIPATVQRLGQAAFGGCERILAVTIPSWLNTIGDGAFSGCESLLRIDVDPGNLTFESIAGILFTEDRTTLLKCPGGKTGHVTLPAETTTIARGAFQSCVSIESVELPAGTTRIEDYMFSGCASLGSFTIPETVTEIGDGAFQYCSALDGLVIPASVTSIGNSAFAHCYGLAELVIPNTVTTMGYHVFYVCSGLLRVTLPDHLTEIGKGWFYRCEQLSEVTIPAGVTSIAESAFNICPALAALTIPDGVTSIGKSAFYRSGLRTITLPASVTSLEAGVFNSCHDLIEILVAPDHPAYRSIDGVLYTKDLRTLVQCPSGKSGPVTVPASVTEVRQNAFTYCDELNVVRYMGDAPTFASSGYNDFTVHYFVGSTGFTQPTWMGNNVVEDAAPTAMGTWLFDHELAYDSDVESDPNHDGVSLLMAYALDLDPRENLRTLMPTGNLGPDTFSLTFRAARAELSYRVEASDQLSDWDDADVTLGPPDGEGVRTASISRTHGMRFLRLSVSE